MSARTKTRGQAALELAILLPIFFFLLYTVYRAFWTNHHASDNSIRLHAQALKAFNHGNSGKITVDGIELVPGRYGEIIPPGIGITPWDVIAKDLPKAALNLGLNALFANVPWLSGQTWWGGAARGAISSVAGTAIEHGVNGLDEDARKAALWAAAFGAFSSGDAEKDMENKWFGDSKGGDIVGHMFQEAAKGYTGSQGDLTKAAAGFASGVFASTTYKTWADKNDVWSGAIQGGLTSALNGVTGGNFVLKDVAIGAGMGAFNTKTVASHFWGAGSYDGDARGLASFGAAQGTISALLHGGSSKEVLYAAMDGAFYSQQTAGAIMGEKGKGDWAQVAGVGVAYGAFRQYIEGADSQQIVMGAFTGGMQFGVSAMQQRMDGYFQNVSNAREANAAIEAMGGEIINSYTGRDGTVRITYLLDGATRVAGWTGGKTTKVSYDYESIPAGEGMSPAPPPPAQEGVPSAVSTN